MKKWLIVVLICLLSVIPVVETSAMTMSSTSNVMLLEKKSTKKKTTKKKDTKKKDTKKKDEKKKDTKKKSDSKKSKSETTTELSADADDLPVDDAQIDIGAVAPDMSHAEDDTSPALAFTSTFNDFLAEYKTLIVGLSGLIDLLLIGVVIFRIVKLASSSQSPMERKNAISALGISLFAVAIMGSFTLWYSLFFVAGR